MAQIKRVIPATLVAMTLGTGVWAESCFRIGATQFINGMQYCVSSVLASQSGNSYGPDKLWDGNNATAWCEGAAGTTGEYVALRVQGGPPFQRLVFDNGYAKSTKAYTRNARPRLVEISTDTGLRFTQTLPDSPSATVVMMPGYAERWVQIRILDVYPGTHYRDTCLNGVFIDFEWEEMQLQMQDQSGKKF